MARVTVEDCLENVDNRFQLVLVATKRARQISTGGKQPNVDWENDKPTVVALREIAKGYITRDILDEVEEESFEDEADLVASSQLEEEVKAELAAATAAFAQPVADEEEGGVEGAAPAAGAEEQEEL